MLKILCLYSIPGSTGKPGMVHTTAGYMVYTAYTFKNVFNYEDNDIFWCTADIGWITGHSYILYGPLLNGATTVILKEFLLIQITVVLEVIVKHKVTQSILRQPLFALGKREFRLRTKIPIRHLKSNWLCRRTYK
jgi:acetyl-CoA synthetase